MTGRARRGFTLVELLVALCVIALLLVLAVPSYHQQLRQSRRAVAVAELLEGKLRQEQYFLAHRRYADTLTELRFPAHPYAVDAHGKPVSAGSAKRIYTIDLRRDGLTYTLSATPQLSQSTDGMCGVLMLDSSGTRRATGSGDVRNCW